MPGRVFCNSLCVMEKNLFVVAYQLVKYNVAVSHEEKPGRTYDHQDDFRYSLGIPIPCGQIPSQQPRCGYAVECQH